MGKFTKEFAFTLSEPITYQFELGEKKTSELTLRAPSNSQAKLVDRMRKELVSAFMGMSAKFSGLADTSKKEGKKQDPSDDKGELSYLMLLYGSDIDIEVYKDAFCELLLDGVCLLDNKIKLTKSLLDDIYYEDLTEMMGTYTENFIVPSWMKRLLAK